MFKKIFYSISVAAMAVCVAAAAPKTDNRLILLHTNDIHSQIVPTATNQGGMMRLSALIDSVRTANRNVILIDAGDAVQGSLYFTLFGGEVERKLMNVIGYDIRVLGNHEFDNGVEQLARDWRQINAARLSTNYDFAGTPLEGLFAPYVIHEKGGRRIAFIGINLNPEGMIAAKNSVGVTYLDPVEAANATAWCLKHNDKADMVVAVSHIGYKGMPGANDVDLAERSKNIDIIIGGHTHTTINPSNRDSQPSRVVNADGDTVLIAQAGRWGQNLGYIEIDLGSLSARSALIPVDARLDGRINTAVRDIVAPYQHSVDSLINIKVCRLNHDYPHQSPELVNFVTDVVDAKARRMAGKRKVDITLMNRGGIRCALPAGDLTKGMVMQLLPFDNRLVLLDIKGSDLLDALEVVAGRNGTDGVNSGVSVTFDPESHKIISATIDGRPIDSDATYLMATIDYLANGGDYMKPLTRANRVAESDVVLYDDVIEELTQGKTARKKLRPDSVRRILPVRH